MKHLHLITGLLISFAVAGCGDYGDDGAVNSTGTDDDTGSTDFTLAVAVPTFGAGGGSKPRLRTEGEAPVARAVTGSAAYTELARGDVRAFVVVADSGNASGYREVPIDVVEFENLGNGRYRIAIDGQAQVDGFFAISINGVVFKIPLSRTGSTDAPIDVNALQAALADRLQALLVANDVCSTVTVDQLNTLLDAGRTYIDGLTVPDDINDVAALIEFYRVSVASFLRERVDVLCAPALNSEAILALVGDYHSLDSGLYAGYDADDLPVLESHSTLKSSKSLVLDETNPALATFSGNDTYDDRFTVTFGGEAGAYSVFQDLSVQNPERDPGLDNLSFAAFAGDANRPVVKYGDVAKTSVIDDARLFVPGFVVTLTPAWQQFPLDGTLFGASQSTTTVFDLSQATASCLTAVGLTTAALTDVEEFSRLAGLALQQPGEDALGKALLANCGPGVPLGYGVSLHVDTPRTTDFGITEMVGRFAVVSLEPVLLSGSDAATSGVGGFASDGVFNIDGEGVLQVVDSASAITQFSVGSTLLAGGDSSLSGEDEKNGEPDDLVRIDVPLDFSQNPATTGELFLEITEGNTVNTYNGFASASRDLFAFDLATIEQGSGIGSGLGGLFMVGDVSGFTSNLLAIQGNYVYAASTTADTLQIVDVSNPAQMLELGTYTPPQSVILDVSVAGNYAYLALDGNGLDVVNIQDPQAPQQATRFDPQQISNIGFAQVSGNYLVAVETVVPVSTSSSILHVIDVSTPTAPVALGSFALSTLNGALNDPAESVSSLVVVGNRVYTTSVIQSTSDWIIRIFDLSVSQGVATLTPLGQRSLGLIFGARDLKVAGNTAYVALGYDGLAIFDVTDPASIGDGGDLGLLSGGSIQSLWVNGTTLNAVYDNSEGPSGIAMINVSDPLQPSELGDIQLSQVDDIVGAGNYVYVGTNTPEAGLLSVNVASAPIDTTVASVQQTYYSQDIVASGNYLYAIGSGLEIFDLTNPQLPAAAGSVSLTNAGMAVAVTGNRAYIASYDGGLFVADISDPQQPTLLPALALALGPAGSGIAVAGDYAYVTDQSSGLQLVNVSGASSVLEQTVPTSGNANAVALSGNYAFVAASGGLDAVNVTNPGNASIVDTETTISNLIAIAISGNYAYVADNSDRNIAVVDISDPTNMFVVNHIASWTYADRLVISGNTLFVLDEAEISIVDISDPLNAFGIAHIDRQTVDAIGGFAVVGQYLYEGDVLPNEDSVLKVHNLPVAVNETKATTGLAIGVRIDQDPPAVVDLVGKQFTLTGQQAGQSSDQDELAAGLGVIAGGSLRFVQVGTEVLPVFDLPLSSVVIANFSGVTPRLSVQFDQWTPSAVAIDANGRISFTLANAATNTTAGFAGYLADNGLLVGRYDALTLTAGSEPVAVNAALKRYPSLTRAVEGIFVGVPRQLPLLP